MEPETVSQKIERLEEIIEEQNGLIAALNFRLYTLINNYDRIQTSEANT